MDNSLYGLPQGSAFITRGNNTYQALPAILNQKARVYSQRFCMAIISHSGTEMKFINNLVSITYLMLAYYDMSEEQCHQLWAIR